MSPTLKSTGVGHCGKKFGEEGVDRCKPNSKAIWKKHAAVVRKRNLADIFCRLSTMHERVRETDRQTTEQQH